MRRVLAVLVVALIAGCGGGPDDAPAGLKVEDVTVQSRAVGKDMAVKVVVPPGGAGGKALLVFLHGRSGDESSYLHEPLYDAVEALGDRAPVIAFADGDEDKYWHDCDSGDWGPSAGTHRRCGAAAARPRRARSTTPRTSPPTT